jgi:hypothetical protein
VLRGGGGAGVGAEAAGGGVQTVPIRSHLRPLARRGRGGMGGGVCPGENALYTKPRSSDNTTTAPSTARATQPTPRLQKQEC